MLLKKHYTEGELAAQGIKETYDWCDHPLSSPHYRVTPSASDVSASVQTPPVVQVEDSSSPSSASAPTPQAPASTAAPPSSSAPGGPQDA